MPATPTEEGSIVAYLRMDDSDFRRKLDEAKLAAERLRDVDPTIRIHVDSADAEAKLAAVRAMSNASGGGGGSTGGGARNIPLPVIAGIAATPLIAPVGAAAAAATGALMGMGAAGILAIKGIALAEQTASSQGDQFAATLGSMQSALATLEATAAAGAFTGLQSAVGDIQSHLPELNQEIGGFAVILGQITGQVVDTLITGFHTLQPLFLDAATGIEGMVRSWQGWTSGGGLAQFVQFAEANLPLVASTLGDLVQAAVRLVEAFAPVGTVVLEAFDLVAQAINLVPPQGLEAIALAAGGVYTAFKLWGGVVPIIEGVGNAVGVAAGVIDAATGPIGWIIGGLSLAALAFAAVSNASQGAAQAQDTYTQALEQSHLAVTQNISDMATQKLADDGALAAASRLGINLGLVTQAVLGNVGAQRELNAELDKHRVVSGRSAAAVKMFGTTQGNFLPDAQKVTDEVRKQSATFDQNRSSAQLTLEAQAAMASGQASDVVLVQSLTNALTTQTNRATLLTDAFKLLDGTNLDFATAQTAQSSAVNSLTDSLKTNGTAINGTSKAAVANQQAVQGVVTAMQAAAEAAVTSGQSNAQAAVGFEKEKESILHTLAAQHKLTPAIQHYIDTLAKIPPSIQTQIEVLNAQNAIKTVDAVTRKFNLLNGRVATVDVNQVVNTFGVGILGGSVPANGKTHSMGGTIGGSGSSSVDTVPTWLAPGEEVISNRRGQASRYRGLLKTVNDNGSPQQVAAAAGVGPTINHFHTWNITTNDPEQLMQFMNAQTRLGMV